MRETKGRATMTVSLSVSRVGRILSRWPRAKERLFSDEEQMYCESRKRRPEQHYAARLAAKMAARRITGTGRLKDFTVGQDSFGAPTLRFLSHIDPVGEFLVSLSHEEDRAAAIVSKVNIYASQV